MDRHTFLVNRRISRLVATLRQWTRPARLAVTTCPRGAASPRGTALTVLATKDKFRILMDLPTLTCLSLRKSCWTWTKARGIRKTFRSTMRIKMENQNTKHQMWIEIDRTGVLGVHGDITDTPFLSLI